MITSLVYEFKCHKCLPHMPKVVFDSWLLNIHLAWKVL
jgi:hypothetical protein